MQNITSSAGLKDAIKLLEAEQEVKAQLLKEQLYLTYESLKPVNLIRHTLKEISSSPYLIDNISGTAMGLLSGFLSRKIFVGTSGNLIRKLVGSILQFGVTNVVAQNSDVIKSIGQALLQHYFRKKKQIP
ncbi:MAG: hypothetical protein ABR927_11415 [Bacteroidales bacterium]|jgi:hypothetical protein